MAQRDFINRPGSSRPLPRSTHGQPAVPAPASAMSQAARPVASIPAVLMSLNRRQPLHAAGLLRQLQRTHGNHYVQRAVEHSRQHEARREQAARPPAAQAKLTVSPANDRYEAEADRVATQVQKILETSAAPADTHDATALSQAAVHPIAVPQDPLSARIQRQPRDDLTGISTGPGLEAGLRQAGGGGQALPSPVRRPMEQAFGTDFDGVRLHADATADRLSRALGAQAFAAGQDIFFSHGKYDPGSAAGQELLAHELTHVVQQRGQTSPRRIQRKIGLELEFPINVDPLGDLSLEQQELLTVPRDGNMDREDLHDLAYLPKDKTIFEMKTAPNAWRKPKSFGFAIVTDHNHARLDPLWQSTPAQVLSNTVLEFIFKPPVENSQHIDTTLDLIYDKVNDINTLTNGLTERKQLVDNFYVGPINTDGVKPEALSTKAYSLQINFGIEPQKIPDLFLSYAETSSDLKGENAAEMKAQYGQFLRDAVHIAVVIETSFRRSKKLDHPLLGLRGLFAIMALYSLAGAGGNLKGGTIKNFTPLFLKTPLSSLAERGLTPEEYQLYLNNKTKILQNILRATRGDEATLDQLLVNDQSGEKTGVTVKDLISEEYKAPFVAAGKAIFPDPVGRFVNGTPRRGAIFETRVSGGSFDRESAKRRAKEMFFRVAILHLIEDEDLLSEAGQSERVQEELQYIEKFTDKI